MNNEDALIRLECLKIANDICKSHNCPYGSDELQAELKKVWSVLYPDEFEVDKRGVWSGRIVKTTTVEEMGTAPKSFQDVWEESRPRNNYPTNL